MWVRSLGWKDPPWRREWQPTPVFLPGESLGQRSLADYSLYCHKESDVTEVREYARTYRGARTWRVIKRWKVNEGGRDTIPTQQQEKGNA